MITLGVLCFDNFESVFSKFRRYAMRSRRFLGWVFDSPWAGRPGIHPLGCGPGIHRWLAGGLLRRNRKPHRSTVHTSAYLSLLRRGSGRIRAHGMGLGWASPLSRTDTQTQHNMTHAHPSPSPFLATVRPRWWQL